MFTPTLTKKLDFRGLKKLQHRTPDMFTNAMSKGGLQGLNWMNNGSRRESRKPPIRFGTLRGSSSVFVGNKLVGVTDISIRSGAPERPTPAKQYNGKPHVLTFVYNTDYATKMHEHEGNWGKFTKQDGDAGNKWLELHLIRDRDDLFNFIELEFRKSVESL